MAGRSSSTHHVVVGTDFSHASQEAVARAIRVAKDGDAKLHVVHAASRMPAVLTRQLGLDDRRLSAELQKVVDRARTKHVRAEAQRVEGGAVGALRRVARDVGADLIVVGTRGRTLPDTFIGSTAERIATLSKTPILLVRNSGSAPYREVVIAADRETELDAPLRAARFVAPDGEPSVLHAYEGPYEATLRLHGAGASAISTHRAHTRAEARAKLVRTMEAAGLEPAALELRHGDPRRVLTGVPAHALLVMKRGSILAHVLLGSATRAVIEHGKSDVLVL